MEVESLNCWSIDGPVRSTGSLINCLQVEIMMPLANAFLHRPDGQSQPRLLQEVFAAITTGILCLLKAQQVQTFSQSTPQPRSALATKATRAHPSRAAAAQKHPPAQKDMVELATSRTCRSGLCLSMADVAG